MNTKKLAQRATLLIAVLFLASTAEAASTLNKVKKRGQLICGVSQGLPGFSNPDKKGQWTGIDVDFCRGMAAAIFGSAKKVKYIPLSAKERFTALQSGEIDVLARNTTWTMQRDTALGLEFIAVTYYDGQGFMVRKNSGVKSVTDLAGATICTNAGTTTELNVAGYFKKNGMKYEIVTFEKTDEAIAAYDNNRCDAYTTDQSGLYANRLKLRNKDEHMILPEIISKEPLGPVARQGDAQFADIARWTVFAMINAEELGLTSKTIRRLRGSNDPSIQRFVGKSGSFGRNMGLKRKWAYNIINEVGNYGEIFERNLGHSSPLHIERGQNALWTKGGLIYAPPIR
jgi:general L-amino acid transport system substrate-binding protein